MRHYFKVWAEGLGLELREDGLYKDGSRVFGGTDESLLSAYFKGCESSLPPERKESLEQALTQVEQEERAYANMWGTAVYILGADHFWRCFKLAAALVKRGGVAPIDPDMSIGLYMGSKWGVLVHALVDEPSEARTAVLSHVQKDLEKRGAAPLTDLDDIEMTLLVVAWGLRNQHELQGDYTPEVVAKLRTMMEKLVEPFGHLDEAGKVQHDLKKWYKMCANGPMGCYEKECY